jgi:excisionase family DNA binding protein
LKHHINGRSENMTVTERAERATLTTEELAEALGISRNKAYEMVRTGGLPIPAIHLGRRIVFSKAALQAFLGQQQPQQEVPAPNDAWAALSQRNRDAFEQILAVCRSALYPETSSLRR